jgi:predicted XRE-type DNA-binding protein
MANKTHDVFTKVNMHGGDTSVCWEWLGGVTGAGRPAFDIGGRKVTPYRLVYELVTGEVLGKGQLIRHKCDNPICCNPTHIIPGTHQENMNDMKERSRHGLPAVAVKAIKKLLSQRDKSHQEIADLYGVDRSTIGRIARGESYGTEPADSDTVLATSARHGDVEVDDEEGQG